MIVVADASVLISLSRLGQLGLLHQRFPEGVWIPMDERDARRSAKRMGLRVLGTVGLLIWAKQTGRIPSLRQMLDELQDRAKFRLSPMLYEQALDAVDEG